MDAAKLPHLKDGPAQFERGVDLLHGRAGTAPDLSLAAVAFLNAAACKEPRGLYSAGMLYLRGIGVMGNRALGLRLLEAAAAQQHPAAGQVLETLRQGGDATRFPIVPVESLEQPAPRALRLPPWRFLRRRAAATVPQPLLLELP
jgi:TPR repeat protein